MSTPVPTPAASPVTMPPPEIGEVVESVTYPITREYLINMDVWLGEHGPNFAAALEHNRRQAWLWLAAGVLVTGVLWGARVAQQTPSAGRVAVGAAMGVLLYAAVVGPLTWFTMMRRRVVSNTMRKNAKMVIARPEFEKSLGPFTACVTDSVFFAYGKQGWLKFPWAMCDDLSVERGALFLRFGLGRGAQIPFDAFADDDHRARFMGAVLDRLPASLKPAMSGSTGVATASR